MSKFKVTVYVDADIPVKQVTGFIEENLPEFIEEYQDDAGKDPGPISVVAKEQK